MRGLLKPSGEGKDPRSLVETDKGRKSSFSDKDSFPRDALREIWGMIKRLLSILVLGAAGLLVATLSGCQPSQSPTKTIVLYGVSITEDVLQEEIILAFQKDWEEKTGQEVKFITSFAGSGTFTNQIVFGASAQIAMVSTELDALSIKKAGLVTTDWRSLNNEGTCACIVSCIVIRKGNPKGLLSFEDLTKQDVEVIYPAPTTSGGARWAILALYGSALKTSEVAVGVPDQSLARELLKSVSLNADSLPESARKALTQFGLGYGDTLLTYENEALHDISKGKEYVLRRCLRYVNESIRKGGDIDGVNRRG